jgi:hypothetical protein
MKGVAGRPSAELLATFFDNILKKGRCKKLSDEAIEETLGKVLPTRDELFWLTSHKHLWTSSFFLLPTGSDIACL